MPHRFVFPILNSKLFQGLFFIGVIALVVVSIKLHFQMAMRFPILPPGTYVGEIKGVFSSDPLGSNALLVQVDADKESVVVAIIRPGWEPRRVNIVSRGLGDNEDVFPVSIDGPEGHIKLSGSQTKGVFGGVAFHQESSEEGKWEVSPMELFHGTEEKALSDWARLKKNILEVDREIGDAEALVPKQKIEIEKLKSFVSDKTRLRTRSDEKFNLLKAELTVIQEKLKLRETETAELKGKMILSQRVTPMGKLVSLARDSIESDSRWLDGIVKTNSNASAIDVDKAYEEALEISRLKKAIAEERQNASQ